MAAVLPQITALENVNFDRERSLRSPGKMHVKVWEPCDTLHHLVDD